MRRSGLLVVFFLCCSCSSVGHYGSQFIIHREKIDNFSAYSQTKSDLISNFGYPTAELEFGTWLYYYYRMRTNSVLADTIEREAVLLVYFDKNDRIASHFFRERDTTGNLTDIDVEESRGGGRKSLLPEILEGLDLRMDGR
ncbi:MAG: hypothetical protein LBU15_04400 [Rickettsiales bacterium]|jgi:outer membrane protein assembly factor BamE (lipoprotein component of BamABCDE complex)|nr:hypothetical protein [Rickettsiales bacterium]